MTTQVKSGLRRAKNLMVTGLDRMADGFNSVVYGVANKIKNSSIVKKVKEGKFTDAAKDAYQSIKSIPPMIVQTAVNSLKSG